MSTTAKGVKLTQRDPDNASAIGNMIEAAAALVMIFVRIMQAMKIMINATYGSLPPIAFKFSAITPERPVEEITVDRPTAAPRMTIVSHSMLFQAVREVMLPVSSKANPPSRAAFSMLITLKAASRIMAMVITPATVAREVRWMR